MVLAILIAPISTSQCSVVEKIGAPTSWSDEINLSENIMRDTECNIAVSGNDVHTVWIHTNYSPLKYYIYYRKSNDSGISWDSISILDNNPNYGLTLPDIAISNNNVHAVWENTTGWDGIYYRNSTDGGENWNDAKRISSEGVNARASHVFVNYSNLHIVWNDWRDGADGEVYYRRSLNEGITFDNGQGVDQDRRITFSPSVVTAPKIVGNDDNISVAWMDERTGNFDLYWMVSKNNGNTWEDGLGHTGQERRLTSTGVFDYGIAQNGSNIQIIWSTETWPGPVYRLYYLNSSDNGATWNSPVLLSGPNSASFAPDIEVCGNNVWVMWNDNRDGSYEIFFKNSSDGGITWSNDTRLTEIDGYNSGGPKIALTETNVNVIWEDERNGSYQEIYYKRSPDFPDTSPPSHSNEIPLPDSYKDAPGTNISVHVTDPSGVNASTIQLFVNGSPVSYSLAPITDGYNVSWVSGGFGPGGVTCRIVAEDMLGNVLDYTWNFTVLANYIIPLQPGWNLVSLPLEQVDTSPQTILDSIDGQYDVVKYYNCVDIADHWKTYRPGSSVNDLPSIDNTMGLWVYVTEYCNLTVHGIIPTSTQINLYAGWNMVSYPSQTTDTVANVLWGTGADRVEVFDPASPYIKEAEPTYIMKPGEGYWIHVPADTVWTVNW